MPLSIVFDAPRRHTARQIMRSSTTLLGSVMVLSGILLASPILPIGLIAAAAMGHATFPFDAGAIRALGTALEALGSDAPASTGVSDELIPMALATTAWVMASVLLIVFGFRLLRRHRALVLFLRRFGHREATTAVTHAVATTIGSGWRLVTLDDGGVAPVGVRQTVRTLIATARRALLLIRLPRVGGLVLMWLAPLMVVVFAWDVFGHVFWRRGTLDWQQMAVAWRQVLATTQLLLESLASEIGISLALLGAIAGAIVAGAMALQLARVYTIATSRWRSQRPQSRSRPRPAASRTARQSWLRRAAGAPMMLAMLGGGYLLIEGTRSVNGLEGALSAGAWLQVGQPYLDVLTDLLNQRLPLARVGVSPRGVFALLASAGALIAIVTVGSLLVLAGGAVLFAPVWLFMSATHTAMARADRNRIAIGSNRELQTAASDIQTTARYALAPRLIVLEVWSGIWQLAVRDLLQISSVSLIDVSDPTENVLWELELIITGGIPCVAIGEHGALAALAVTAHASMDAASPAGRLVHLLDGRQVLAYTTDPAGTTRFARALRSRLLEASLVRAGKPPTLGETP